MSLFNDHFCHIRKGSANSQHCDYSKLLTKLFLRLCWTLLQFLSNTKTPEPWQKRRKQSTTWVWICVRRSVHREQKAPTVVKLSIVGINNQQFCKILSELILQILIDMHLFHHPWSMEMLKYTEHSCLPHSYTLVWKHQVTIECWSDFSTDIPLWRWIHH